MQEIRIGIVGYGTVGRASAEILTSHAEEIRSRTGGLSIRVARICRRTPGAAENGVNGIPVVSDWREVVSASDVDIVVEAIGGTSVAYDVIRASLKQGKAVVTANKALIAQHGEELFALARRKNLPIGIEASVAGGVPVIEPGKPLVVGNLDGMQALGGVHKAKLVNFMRIGKPNNGFQAFETEISGILTDAPHEFGGTHAHMEAHLYILDGVGHTVIDGEPLYWKKGSAFQVVGPQTVHQHVNDGDTETQMLRVAFGIRYFFEGAAKEEFPYLFLAYRQGIQAGERERERVRERTR